MRFEVRFVIGPTYGSDRWLSTFTCISFWFRPSDSQSPLVVARFSLISMGCLHFLLEKRVKVCGVLLKKTKCKCTNFNSNKIAGALPTVSYRSLCRDLYSIQICSTQRSSGIGPVAGPGSSTLTQYCQQRQLHPARHLNLSAGYSVHCIKFMLHPGSDSVNL